jgi:hypothetical protein
MGLALDRLDERTGPQREAKEIQKRLDLTRNCLRKTIMMAASKNARLLNAKQMLVQIVQALHTFYGELHGGGGETQELKGVQKT